MGLLKKSFERRRYFSAANSYWKPFNFWGKRDAFFTDPSGLYGSFRRYGPTSCLTIVAETTEIVQSTWVFNWGKGVGDVCFGGQGDLKTFCLTMVGCKSLLGTKYTAYLVAWNYEFSCLFLFGDFCWDD